MPTDHHVQKKETGWTDSIRNEQIKMKLEVTYLSMILDDKLLWNKHAEAVTKKATCALRICECLMFKPDGT